MPILSILNQAPGPLPLTVSFNLPTSGPACLMVSGSVWTQHPNQMIGIQISVDGKAVGTASIYSNLQATHRAVIPSFIPVQFEVGNHQLVLSQLNSVTVSDINDRFDVALIY